MQMRSNSAFPKYYEFVLVNLNVCVKLQKYSKLPARLLTSKEHKELKHAQKKNRATFPVYNIFTYNENMFFYTVNNVFSL
jgi:hypothetical protein